MEERPELIVEMLFSKINSTAHFLEYGYEKQTVSSKPRAAAELEVKGGKEWEDQIGIVVSALLDRNEGQHIQWIKGQLSPAEIERRSWEVVNVVLLTVEEDPFAGGDEAPAADVEPPKAPAICMFTLLMMVIQC